MDFDAADLEFQRLEGLLKTGQINREQYLTQLHAIQVRDASGRIWMLQERTGVWMVYDQGQWQAMVPPGRVPSAPLPPQAAPQMPASTQVQQVRRAPNTGYAPPVRPSRRRQPGCISITLRLLLWALFWAGAAWMVDTLWRGTPLWAYAAVGAGALLTLILWVRRITRGGRAARKSAQGGAS